MSGCQRTTATLRPGQQRPAGYQREGGGRDPFDAGRLIIGTEGRGFWTTKVSAEDFTAAATAIPDGALAESQIEGLAETLAVVPSSAKVARFRNTDSLHELAAIQQQSPPSLGSGSGLCPDYRVSTLPRTSLSNDLTITSGDLYLFRLIFFKDFWAKKLRWSVGKSTALGGATLARFGIYEQGADLGMTLRAATATTHTTAFQTTGSTETAPLSTGGSLPRTYLLRYGTEYYFAGLVVGTLTNGSWRGCDLNGTGLLEPVAAYRVTGQTDLPATIAAGSLTSTDRLGGGLWSNGRSLADNRRYWRWVVLRLRGGLYRHQQPGQQRGVRWISQGARRGVDTGTLCPHDCAGVN